MKFCLFNFKCPGVVLAFLSACSTAGTLHAGEPLPEMSGDLTAAPVIQKEILGSSTNRPQWKGPLPSKPKEINIDEWRDRTTPFAPPPRRMVNPDRNEKDLLNNQDSWGYVTPQDIIDDYMARNILKMPEFGPDGKRRSPTAAVEYFLGQLGRGTGQTNTEPFSRVLFGVNNLAETKRERGELDGDADDGSATFGVRRTPFGLPPSRDLNNNNLSSDRSERFVDSGPRKDDDLTPEGIRQRKIHEEHMESFKKVWSLDEPTAPGLANSPGSPPWQNIPTPHAQETTPGTLRPLPSAPLPGTALNPPPVPGFPSFSSMSGVPGSSPAPVTAPSMPSPSPSRDAVRAMMKQSSTFTVPDRKF